MCTVSWAHRAGGYDLLCNRDERANRPEAQLPRVRVLDRVRYLAPLDPEGGGTWIGVNEYGVTAGVLNAHPKAYVRPAGPPVSRGLLVQSLLSSRSPVEAIERVTTDGFAPFQLVLLAPHAPVSLVVWDGCYKLVVLDADSYRPLVSSSLDERLAWRQRRREWQDRVERRGAIDGELLQEFHRSHDPKPGPWSVCMHRDDARTVSFCHVSVDDSRARLDYSPGSPCKASLVVTTTLRLVERTSILPCTPDPGANTREYFIRERRLS